MEEKKNTYNPNYKTVPDTITPCEPTAYNVFNPNYQTVPQQVGENKYDICDINNKVIEANENSSIALDNSLEALSNVGVALEKANEANGKADGAITASNDAKSQAEDALIVANGANDYAITADSNASEAKRIAQEALDKVVEGTGTTIIDYNGNKLKEAKFKGSTSINVDMSETDPHEFEFRVDKAILDNIDGKLNKVTEQEKVYGTDGIGNQITLQYNEDAIGGGLAKRTNGGQLKVNDAVNDNEAVSKSQLNTTNNNVVAINLKASANEEAIETINTTLPNKANVNYVDDALALKANTQYVNTELEKKVSKSDFLDVTYPIGSIYISINTTSPASLFGGSWEQLASGKTLWTDANGGGGTIDAGLPNITGKVAQKSSTALNAAYNWLTPEGALKYETGSSNDGYNEAGPAKTRVLGFSFDASKSNAIYGKSSTVQPPAIKVCMWKRTA